MESVVVVRFHHPIFLGFLALVLVAASLFVPATAAGAVIDSAVIVPTPNAGTLNDGLQSVSCVTTSWCTAVGNSYDAVGQTLIESFTGPEPPPSTTSTTVEPTDPARPAFTG